MGLVYWVKRRRNEWNKIKRVNEPWAKVRKKKNSHGQVKMRKVLTNEARLPHAKIKLKWRHRFDVQTRVNQSAIFGRHQQS